MIKEVLNLYKYDKNFIGKRAAELGFIRDTLEKVYRLADVLEYLNTNPMLKDNLALKGGTAINLTIFNLPRLSVDIDLDYLGADSRDEMLKNREVINLTISKFMLSNGYSLSPKTKSRIVLIHGYTNILTRLVIKITLKLKSTIL